MAQRDYILRMFEEMSRVLAQIISHRQIKNYQAAHDLIDEQLRQTLGMGSGFIHSLPDETLLSLLTTLDRLNAEKCWLTATLLKIEGDLYEEECDGNRAYHSYLKACNLFLETLYDQSPNKNIAQSPEIEALLSRLEEYELPLRTQWLLFWYFECSGRYGKAEVLLFDMLELETNWEDEARAEIIEMGEAFYARLLGKNDAALMAGNFSRPALQAGLARLHTITI